MNMTLDTGSMDDYQTFLKVKSLPSYRIVGHEASFPDYYAHLIGLKQPRRESATYTPSPFLFDYQADIATMAVRLKRFSIFADCGLGKTLIFLDMARHALSCLPDDNAILIVSPLMVVEQTIEEAQRWYGDSLPVEHVTAAGLNEWLSSGRTRLGITNFEAMRDDVAPGRLGGLIIDESSMLKSHYGKWGSTILRLGRGLEWKMACTGTPAPNDRIEYANHAVFMDAFPNVNAFLARYFVNKGQTAERWVLKPHAIRPFYSALSAWSIFLANPATYGWHDHATDIPPIHVHIDRVTMTDAQRNAAMDVSGMLIPVSTGGIGQRSKLGQIAKGRHAGHRISTEKPQFIRNMVNSWPQESTIIWCLYNDEQDQIYEQFPDAANITGATPHDVRQRLISDFKSGRRRVLITKPKILGFGLNLQAATRQVFSGLQDSYEQFYQAVKRSNRVGSTRPLNVHIPVTDIERPMIETVLSKAKRVQQDAEEQERLFHENAIAQR